MRLQLEQVQKELEFHKKNAERLSNRYLRDLEELSRYAELLNEQVQTTEAQYQQISAILDSIPVEICISDHTTYEILFMNTQMKESFEKSSIGEICYEAFLARDTPCPHCIYHEGNVQGESGKTITTWEQRNLSNDKWYLLYQRSIAWVDARPARIMIGLDISKRKEAEQALKESQSRYQALSQMLRLMCDNVPDMIWAKDLENRYLFANKALCRQLLCATDTDEPVGKTDLFFAAREQEKHPDNLDWHTIGALCLESDGVVLEKRQPLHLDECGNAQGVYLFLDVYKTPFFDEKGHLIGTVGSARDVTRAKAVELKLKAQEARYLQEIKSRYRAIIEGAQEGICAVDSRCIITFVNQKMSRMLGYEAEEFIGRDMGAFFLPEDQHSPCELRQHLYARTAGLNKSYTRRCRTKDGQNLWMIISTTIVQDTDGIVDGAFLMFTDITEAREATRQLVVNFERLNMAQAVGKTGCWEYDIASESIWISDQCFQVCGLSLQTEKETLTRQLLSCLSPEATDCTLLENGPGKDRQYEAEFILLPSSGTGMKYIRSVFAVIQDEREKPQKCIGVIKDITERKKGEIELKKTNAQLLHAEKLTAVGKLSASIAHEFNNPLQGVFNVLHGVQERAEMSAEDQKLVNMALVECKRMKDLIRSLQDFNRPSQGTFDWVNLQEMVDSLFVYSNKDFSQRGLQLQRHYAPDLPLVKVIGDQIKQVILNLLQNAADACRSGDTITIELNVNPSGEMVIRVSDTGCGIGCADIKHIFDPFFTTKPTLKGTGLGLSISYGIIKKHGGTIDVVSKQGKGTTFTVVLPREGSPADEEKNSLC